MESVRKEAAGGSWRQQTESCGRMGLALSILGLTV